MHSPTPPPKRPAPSVLAWSAWRRCLALLPLVLLLWVAVAWANAEVAPW